MRGKIGLKEHFLLPAMEKYNLHFKRGRDLMERHVPSYAPLLSGKLFWEAIGPTLNWPISVFLAKGYNRISLVARRAPSERISKSDKWRDYYFFLQLSQASRGPSEKECILPSKIHLQT